MGLLCLHDILKTINEINQSCKLCQVRGKNTVGGIIVGINYIYSIGIVHQDRA